MTTLYVVDRKPHHGIDSSDATWAQPGRSVVPAECRQVATMTGAIAVASRCDSEDNLTQGTDGCHASRQDMNTHHCIF